jgi:tetratricopeptide (TPR) repeat protein
MAIQPRHIAIPLALLAAAFIAPRLLHGFAWGPALKPKAPQGNPDAAPLVPFAAPDVDFIAQSRSSADGLTLDRIWLAPLPSDRPDLAAYRPMHGMLLKWQYDHWRERWPATVLDRPRSRQPSSDLFRAHSLFYYQIFCAFSALWVWLALGPGRASSAWGAFAALFLIALHPMSADAIDSASSQHVLLAAICWAAALVFHQLTLLRRLPIWIASPLIALAFFTGAAAHEATFLLPLAILANELLGERAPFTQRKESKKNSEKRAPALPPSEMALFRAIVLGLPMAAAAGALLALRWIALDGALLPAPASRALPDAGLGERLTAGLSAMVLGLRSLLLPWRPTFFHSPRYEPGLILPIWATAPILLAFIVFAVAIARRSRKIALGALLVLLPLFACAQFAPTVDFFSERLLVLSLPGFGLIAGVVAARLLGGGAVAEAAASRAAPSSPAIGLAAAAALLALSISFGWVSFQRSRLWGETALASRESTRTKHNNLWIAEAERHPDHPDPVTFQLIESISRFGREVDLALVESLRDRVIELAEPPDRDRALHYMALLHLARGDAEAAGDAIDAAFVSPEPHSPGFFSKLGAAALQAGQLDRARDCMERELEVDPDSFEALFGLASILAAAPTVAEIERAIGLAREAADRAPPHRAAEAHLVWGRAATRINRFADGAAALRKAIELDDRLADAYLELARLMVANEQYAAAEQIIYEARVRSQPATLREFADVSVESRLKQNNPAAARDVLRQVAQENPLDLPLQLYAGDRLFSMGDFASARAIFNRVLSRMPTHPDALYGLAAIALTENSDMNQAAMLLARSIAANPGHQRSRALLQQIRDRVEGRTPTPTPPPR